MLTQGQESGRKVCGRVEQVIVENKVASHLVEPFLVAFEHSQSSSPGGSELVELSALDRVPAVRLNNFGTRHVTAHLSASRNNELTGRREEDRLVARLRNDRPNGKPIGWKAKWEALGRSGIVDMNVAVWLSGFMML